MDTTLRIKNPRGPRCWVVGCTHRSAVTVQMDGTGYRSAYCRAHFRGAFDRDGAKIVPLVRIVEISDEPPRSFPQRFQS